MLLYKTLAQERAGLSGALLTAPTTASAWKYTLRGTNIQSKCTHSMLLGCTLYTRIRRVLSTLEPVIGLPPLIVLSLLLVNARDNGDPLCAGASIPAARVFRYNCGL